MSKLTKILSALFAAAAVLTACEVDSLEAVEEIGKEITVSFSAEELETRTVLGDYADSKFSVFWTKNQDVRIFPSTSYADAINASVVPSRDKLSASFNGKISVSSTARVSFALLSPASAFNSNEGANVRITVPTNQTPTESSTDEMAQILVDKTETFRPAPVKVTFHPSHLTAYIALRFKNIPTSIGRNIVCEVKAPSTVPLSGTVDYNFTDGTMTPVTTSNSVKASVLSTSGICFIGCLPAKVSGKSLSITLKGLAGSVSKTILVPSGKNFLPGKLAAMTIDFTQTVAPTGVTVSPTSLDLTVGESATLTATVTPSNATNKSVTWTSSSSSVASVSSSGVVTAKSAGTAFIFATTVNGKRSTASVTVTNPATRIELMVRRPDNTDYSYDADEDVYHMSKGGSKNLYYTVYYADGSTTSDSGAKLSIISGSGIQLSGDYAVQCIASGQTAVVRFTSTTTPSVYTDLTIKTWDPVQSITLSQDNGFLDNANEGWIKEGAYVILYAKISPSTARQKAVFTVTDNVGGFTVTRHTDTAAKVQAPTVNGSTVYAYTSKFVKIKVADQTANKSVTQQLLPTNLELTVPKMFDIVTYNKTASKYEVLDGGLRVLISASGGVLQGVKEFYCNEEKANYTPSSSAFVPVGVVTYYNNNKNLPGATITSSSRPSIEYNVGPNYRFSLSNSYFHGFAIALNNRNTDDWSDDFKNRPESSSHWNTSIGSTQYSQYVQGDDPYRAFDLTVLGAYYNGAMSSLYTIRPVNNTWHYPDPGFEYDVSAWPGSVASYKMRPWVTPTVWNYRMLMNGNGKMNTDVIDVLNWRISALGGTKIFQTSSDYYWTINTSSDNIQNAYKVGTNGPSEDVKIAASLLFRPFMVF